MQDLKAINFYGSKIGYQLELVITERKRVVMAFESQARIVFDCDFILLLFKPFMSPYKSATYFRTYIVALLGGASELAARVRYSEHPRE